MVTLDHLGESVRSSSGAEAYRDAYIEALRRVEELGLAATISVKLTQLGLEISEALCRQNVEPLVQLARRTGNRVEIDMEASPLVDRTLAIVEEMHLKYGCVRGVIQAYLRRSEGDLLRLCELGAPVRLCKGAYKEPSEMAFPRKRDVNRNYVRLARALLEKGREPALATHDPKMITAALDYARQLKLPAESFEFQMLYGIRRDLQSALVRQGFRLRLYVPYGNAWYPYFMRRLAERPANLLFLLRHLFRS
jgi:proline dehydrogenase